MHKKMVSWVVMAMCAYGQGAMAQASDTGKVQLWGIVDTAIRYTDHEGVSGNEKVARLIGGGMSQSRWGLKVEEELGGGVKALIELENRFTADDGHTLPGDGPFFQLAHIGLQGPFGRLTLGRQWNVLFDVVTSTYASFPYSPYMDAYKPELGMAVGARSSNALKYLLANKDRSFVAAIQYAFDEGNNASSIQNMGIGMAQQMLDGSPFGLTSPINPLVSGMVQTAIANNSGPDSALANAVQGVGRGAMKNYGGFLRWSNKTVSLGAGYLRTELPAASKLDAWTLGGSYRSGALYLNAGYGENKVKYKGSLETGGVGQSIGQYVSSVAAYLTDQAILGQMWGGQTNGGFQPGDANKRRMYKLGFGYQLTTQLNVGAHYYHAKQQGGATGFFNGKADFMIVAGSYQLSKRTDVYAAVDHTKLKGGRGLSIDSDVMVRKRTGMTMGVRHRF